MASPRPIPQKEDVEKWTVEQVAAWLGQMELTDCCEFVLRKGIDGRSLMEITEEGLVLWGRDVSIKNRKKILKLIKQIENQYLVLTGRLQPSQISGSFSRQTLTNQAMDTPNGDLPCSGDEDGYDTDEFDDDVEQEPFVPHHDNHEAFRDLTESGSAEEDYLIPLKAAHSFPSQPQRPLPSKPIQGHTFSSRQPAIPLEKRPPMPLPHENVLPQPSQKSVGPKLPVRPRGSTPTPAPNNGLEIPCRLSPVSGLRPIGPKPSPKSIGPKPILMPLGPKPGGLGNIKPSQHRDWPPKQTPEPPASQNSIQSESTSAHRFSLPSNSQCANYYEEVKNPLDLMGNESHVSCSGLSPSGSEPPPLPSRNIDGRDGSNITHGRFSAGQSTRSQSSTPGPPTISSSRPSVFPSSISQKKVPIRPSDLTLKGRPGGPNPLPGRLGKELPRCPSPISASEILPPSLMTTSSNSPPQEIAPKLPALPNSMPLGKPVVALPSSMSLGKPVVSSSNTMPLGKPVVSLPNSIPLGLPAAPMSNSTPLGLPVPPQQNSTSIGLPMASLKKPTPLANERYPLGNGESIELTPLYRSLMERPFFHVISWIKSKELLQKAADGVFLIRPSTRSKEPLTICLRCEGRTYNINIRQRPDSRYALGSIKENEMAFHTIEDLVRCYTSEPLKLLTGNRVLLKSSPPKDDHVYVKMPISSKFQNK